MDVSLSTPIVVLVTFPSLELARSISATLVGEGLAACVNLLPGVESVFWWEGKVESASEVLGLIKTKSERVKALEQKYLELHPYAVPEFLTLGRVGGNPDYLKWLTQSVAAVETPEET